MKQRIGSEAWYPTEQDLENLKRKNYNRVHHVYHVYQKRLIIPYDGYESPITNLFTYDQRPSKLYEKKRMLVVWETKHATLNQVQPIEINS